ncbi:unnamed protein product [Brassicogethes aeneus]|uniref:Fatty acid desaturase domain-containing protein n=1 Tax=Brassicogethes aeneus TaxID=1431903 RepID=A0A9P0FIP4_BRAAE|nr:unnamed protein product [Brassicogethes aeneus]
MISNITLQKKIILPKTTILRTSVKKLEHKKYESIFGTFKTELIWTNIMLIFTLHTLSAIIIVSYPWITKFPLVLYAFTIGGIGGFGVTGGAHRYWTHKSFKAKLPLKLILLMSYSVAGQNSLKNWVRDHRVHHKFSETSADPHDSNRGFFFAHCGWLMMKKHPDVLEKGKVIDCSDLMQDPIIRFHEKYFVLFKLVFCFILPTIIPPLLWNESWFWTFCSTAVVRYCLTLNFTWAVNSAAHLWGNKPYAKNINPSENLTVSIVAMGEGWHNYHHTFPWDYKTSENGRYNLTKNWLDFFYAIGWAYDMKSPSDELVKKVVEKNGDGSHWQWGMEYPESEDKYN